MAVANAASSTVTTRSTRSRTIPNVWLSGSMFPARPSASVGPTSTVTGRPAASAPVNTGDAAASAPTISASFSTSARDDRRPGQEPAAAERDDERVEIGTFVEHLQCHRAGAGDDVAMAVRRHECRARAANVIDDGRFGRVVRGRGRRSRRPAARARRALHQARSQADGRAPSTPEWRAAVAIASPWLPAEAVVTSTTDGRSSFNRRSALAAPRILNDPVAWTISSFSQISAPVASDSQGDRTSGVRHARPLIRRRRGADVVQGWRD